MIRLKTKNNYIFEKNLKLKKWVEFYDNEIIQLNPIKCSPVWGHQRIGGFILLDTQYLNNCYRLRWGLK